MHPGFAVQQNMMTLCYRILDALQCLPERLDAAYIIPNIELVGTNTLWKMETLTHK